jgi:Fibronectin type III domain
LVTASTGDTCSTAQLSCTIDGLENGTAVTFTVRAFNWSGSGVSSTASDPVTPSTVPKQPAAPSVIPGEGSATVSWVAPSGRGAAVAGYIITACDGLVCTTYDRSDSNATSAVVTGLINGDPYVFYVTAVNANGQSAASPNSAVVVPLYLTPATPVIGSAVAGVGSVTIS